MRWRTIRFSAKYSSQLNFQIRSRKIRPCNRISYDQIRLGCASRCCQVLFSHVYNFPAVCWRSRTHRWRSKSGLPYRVVTWCRHVRNRGTLSSSGHCRCARRTAIGFPSAFFPPGKFSKSWRDTSQLDGNFEILSGISKTFAILEFFIKSSKGTFGVSENDQISFTTLLANISNIKLIVRHFKTSTLFLLVRFFNTNIHDCFDSMYLGNSFSKHRRFKRY